MTTIAQMSEGTLRPFMSERLQHASEVSSTAPGSGIHEQVCYFHVWGKHLECRERIWDGDTGGKREFCSFLTGCWAASLGRSPECPEGQSPVEGRFSVLVLGDLFISKGPTQLQGFSFFFARKVSILEISFILSLESV